MALRNILRAQFQQIIEARVIMHNKTRTQSVTFDTTITEIKSA